MESDNVPDHKYQYARLMHTRQSRGSGSSRSPLKAPPLRTPGQSLSEELERVRSDKLMDAGVVVVIALSMTLMAAIQWWLGTPPATLFFISLLYLAGAIIYAVVRVRSAKRQIHQLRQGRDGEIAVAEYLDTLAQHGVRPLHDLIGDGFNVDHIAVTPQGVLVIETKTVSKPTDRDARVVFDGETVTVDGHVPDRDPVTQARASASWVRGQLKEALGREYAVRPVVVYPGWYVNKVKGSSRSDVWVLNPKSIEHFLKHEPTVLTDQDMSQIVYFLKRFVRTQQDAKQVGWST